MKDNFDKQPDQTQKPDSGQGAGQSSQFDFSRHLLGTDGRRNTCVPQNRLFRDHINSRYQGPDVPPQHAEETPSTSFRHDAPSQESPMSASGTLEMMRDGELLRQADNHYAQGQYEEAEQLLRYDLDNCAKEPKPNDLRIELIGHGLARVREIQEKYGDAEQIYMSMLNNRAKAYEGRYEDIEQVYNSIHESPQRDDLILGWAMKGLGNVYAKEQKHKEAKALFKCGLEIYKKEFGIKDHRTAKFIASMAEVYQMQENPAKAKALYEYVLPIYKEKFGENDPRTEKVQKNLTDLPVKPGQELGITSGTRRLISEERRPNILLYYIKSHKRFLDICNPKLFNEKALHRSLFDRRPERRLFGDKYEVRKHVRKTIGGEYLPKLYHVVDPHYQEDKLKQQTDNTNLPSKMQYSTGLTSEIARSGIAPEDVSECESISTDPGGIPFDKLPDKFVIKSSQGARSSRVLVVDKSTMDESKIIQECKGWISSSRDYYKETGGWDYKNITPRILIEEYIDDGKGPVPYDYKFFTYNGVPHYIQVHAGRFGRYSIDSYDTQWNKLAIKGVESHESNPTLIDKPPHLEKMLELAQQLGKGTDFVRIDFYDTPEKVFFGEITSVPGRGMSRSVYDRILGEPWTEVYNKCSVPSPDLSPDLPEIIRQITCVTHKVILEGQRNREEAQLKRKAKQFDGSPKKRSRKEDLP